MPYSALHAVVDGPKHALLQGGYKIESGIDAGRS